MDPKDFTFWWTKHILAKIEIFLGGIWLLDLLSSECNKKKGRKRKPLQNSEHNIQIS